MALDPSQSCCGDKTVFNLNAEVYHGVLARSGDARFSVSPNGFFYVFQQKAVCRRCNLPYWDNVARRKSLAVLLPYIFPEIVALLPHSLPDLSTDFVRPWAQAMRDASAALSAEWQAYKALPYRQRKLLPRPGSK